MVAYMHNKYTFFAKLSYLDPKKDISILEIRTAAGNAE